MQDAGKARNLINAVSAAASKPKDMSNLTDETYAAHYKKRKTDIEHLHSELKTILAGKNITLLGELGFENAYALVMPRKRAEELGIHSIADLAPHAGTMSMAADYEFFSRPEWAALREAYGLAFRAQRHAVHGTWQGASWQPPLPARSLPDRHDRGHRRYPPPPLGNASMMWL
jgi:hypothetical protein